MVPATVSLDFVDGSMPYSLCVSCAGGHSQMLALFSPEALVLTALTNVYEQIALWS